MPHTQNLANCTNCIREYPTHSGQLYIVNQTLTHNYYFCMSTVYCMKDVYMK